MSQLDQSITEHSPNSHEYHVNIHTDEEKYRDELAETYFRHLENINPCPSTLSNTMVLSGTINRLDTFAISTIDTSNYRYFQALFRKLAEEAEQSNHQLVFPGLDDLTYYSVIYCGVQNEMVNLLLELQEKCTPSLHTQEIQITI